MIHRYEIHFSVMYDGKVTDLQSVIIPASSLEEAKKGSVAKFLKVS